MPDQLSVLDLYAGLGGFSQAFVDRGHHIVTVDMDPRFNPTIVGNIRHMTTYDIPQQPFDVVLASPPCTCFTVMQIGRNWNKDHTPKTQAAADAWQLVQHTVELIGWLNPTWWVMENPRGKLRRLMERRYLNIERRTTTYCGYGEKRMKATDLWSDRWPDITLKPVCHNGDPCHISSPRGSTNGTQGMDPALAAKVPYELSLAFCLACESGAPATVNIPQPQLVTSPTQEAT